MLESIKRFIRHFRLRVGANCLILSHWRKRKNRAGRLYSSQWLLTPYRWEINWYIEWDDGKGVLPEKDNIAAALRHLRATRRKST